MYGDRMGDIRRELRGAPCSEPDLYAIGDTVDWATCSECGERCMEPNMIEGAHGPVCEACALVPTEGPFAAQYDRDDIAIDQLLIESNARVVARLFHALSERPRPARPGLNVRYLGMGWGAPPSDGVPRPYSVRMADAVYDERRMLAMDEKRLAEGE